jgi:hypothetical protein
MLQGLRKSETLASPRLRTQHSMQDVRQARKNAAEVAPQDTTMVGRQDYFADLEPEPSADPRDSFRPMVGPHDRRFRGKISEGHTWDYDVPKDLREQLRTRPKVLGILRGSSYPKIDLNRSFGEALDWVLNVDDEAGLCELSSEVFEPRTMSLERVECLFGHFVSTES